MKSTDNILAYKTADKMNVQANIAHMQQHLDVIPFLDEVVSKIDTKNQEFIKVSIEMGRIIGKTNLVKTTPDDEIVYAIRTGRRILTRFVKNRQGDDCSTVCIILKKLDGIRYKLLTAYIGRLGEKEAGDHSIQTEEEYATCKGFWDHHALTWDETVDVTYIAFPGVEPKLPQPIRRLRNELSMADD